MAKKNKKIEVKLVDNTINESEITNGTVNMKQLLAPSAISYPSENELLVEENYVKSFVINGYPSRVSVGWMDDLYSYGGDMDVATYIEPANERLALDEITRKITQYESQLDTELERGSIRNSSMLRSKIEALYEQRSRLEQNWENMFHVSTLFTMYNKDLKTLQKDSQKFRSRLSGGRMSVMPLTLREGDGFKTVSPYGVNCIPDYYRNMNTGALSTMFPFYNPEVNHQKGTFIGINRLRNTPVIIDLFNRRVLGNANLSILGVAGFGKTTLASAITLRSTLESIRTVIIDPENEYGPCSDVVNGSSIKIAPNSESVINPFDIDVEYKMDKNGEVTEEQIVDIKGKVSELLSLFCTMVPECMDSNIKAHVSAVLTMLYDNFGFTQDAESLYENVSEFNEETGEYFRGKVLKKMPRLTDFYNLLVEYAGENEELLNVANSFTLYCEGGLYDLFDQYTTIPIDTFNNAPIIRFDISGIEDDVLRPIGMHVVMTWTWNKFIKKDLKTKKRIICDEAWMMLSTSMAGSEFSALFLEKCARRIRKYNGSLCCVSQNFREFAERKEGRAILSNSAVKIFMRQAEGDIEAVGDKFILSGGEREFLLTAGRGEALAKVGKESFIIDVLIFQFEQELISKKHLSENG
jgi:type IV secretory pathway VirB4 component